MDLQGKIEVSVFQLKTCLYLVLTSFIFTDIKFYRKTQLF